jgi:excisionase family DNA binding protein
MEDLISIRQASAMLGLSRSTVRDWVWRRKIPHVRVGGAVRFRPSDLRAFIEAGAVPAAPRQPKPRQRKTERGGRSS